jgi:prepilin signal peptidase PulO-like enzyme (type II secretory pathway)
MYRDNSEATRWRADALERERQVLKHKLQEQEETIKRQLQQIHTLKNKGLEKPTEATNQLSLLSTAEVRALIKTCTTCGAPVEPDEDYQAMMFEGWHLHHRSCLEKISAPPKSILGRGLLLFAILPALFFAFVLLLGMASISPPAGIVAGTMGVLALIGIFWFIVWVIAEFG